MNRMTDYSKKKALSAALGISVETFPTKVYIAAFKTATTDAGGGTEVTGGGYARQQVTFVAPTISVDTGTTSNTATITFPTATAAWGTVTHVALYDALTNGNMLYHGAVASPRSIEVGDQLRILAGDLMVQQK